MSTSLRERVAWSAITIGLGLEIRFDFLGLLAPGYKSRFQADSDSIVYSTLADPSRGLFDPMLRPTGVDYASQFGLQGIVGAIVSPGRDLYGAMRVVTALLLAAVIATAVVACWRAWGGRAAAVLLGLLVSATWLNAFGQSTYWQVWTMFLPVLVPLLVWPRLGHGRRKWLKGGALIAALVCLKALCGYEYITTVIIAAASAVAFHEFRERFDRALLVRLVGVMTAGVAGFVAAIVCHMVQLYAAYGSFSAIWVRANERTFSPSTFQLALDRARGEEDPLLGRLVEGDSAVMLWIYRMINYLRDPAVSIPTVDTAGHRPVPYGLPIWIFLIIFAVLAWQAFRDQTVEGVLQRRLAVAAGLGLLGGLSWMVLGYGHMINHPHLEAIVFYVPFLPLLFAMIALRVQSRYRRPRPQPLLQVHELSSVTEVPRDRVLVAPSSVR